MLVAAVADAIACVTGPLETAATRGVGGGCISDAWMVQTRDGERFFVKTCPADQFGTLEAERDGLAELALAEAPRVPRCLGCGVAGGSGWLLLEWLDLEGSRSAAAHRLGEQLAALHRHTATLFGWSRDNTIGTTPQRNSRSCDWPQFFADCRLRPQLELAARHGHAAIRDAGMTLLQRLPDYFAAHEPQPSLLHGDLWGGNWGVTAAGEPVIFDPAVYYGDREADLAMTRLFGGFDAGFYEAYESAWPLAPGCEDRCDLYNLYHVLNHLNLFGESYHRKAAMMIDDLRHRSLEGS